MLSHRGKAEYTGFYSGQIQHRPTVLKVHLNGIGGIITRWMVQISYLRKIT